MQNRYNSQKFTAPFRLGRKQSRAVLDSEGRQVVVFNKGCEQEAQDYVDFLNSNNQREATSEQKTNSFICKFSGHVFKSGSAAWSVNIKYINISKSILPPRYHKGCYFAFPDGIAYFPTKELADEFIEKYIEEYFPPIVIDGEKYQRDEQVAFFDKVNYLLITERIGNINTNYIQYGTFSKIYRIDKINQCKKDLRKYVMDTHRLSIDESMDIMVGYLGACQISKDPIAYEEFSIDYIIKNQHLKFKQNETNRN